MLIEFEVGNYLSFKKPVRLSMLAANPIKDYLNENTFEAGRYRLLKGAVIYGANASGKSNLLDAMAFMCWFVQVSSKATQVDEKIQVRPFKLDTTTENAPSHFQICFLQNGQHYRYGFEADNKAIRKEWLFHKKTREVALFLREDDSIDVHKDFSEGKGLEERTRENALFLSVVAQFNGEIAGNILKWFKGVVPIHGLMDNYYEEFTARLNQNKVEWSSLMEFMRRADVGIEDMSVNELSFDDESSKPQPKELRRKEPKTKKYIISSVHQKFHDGIKKGQVIFDFSTEESEGTKKFFRIAGPILESLKNGYVVIIDELDAKLHPLLTKAIVRLFNSAASNPKNAQLVFVTHDTNLLNDGKFRRDQIWFTEKNQQEASDLYSLAEIKLPKGTKVRKDEALEKNYIKGRYGAIPFIGDLAALFKERADGASRKAE
jgi:uncharacterized protein